MTLIRDTRETVAARIRREPAFASALIDEALSLLARGDRAAAGQSDARCQVRWWQRMLTFAPS